MGFLGFQLFVSVSITFALKGCDARSWSDLVNPAVCESGSFDPYKIEYAIEEDPFSVSAPAPAPLPAEDVFIGTEDVDRDDEGSDTEANEDGTSASKTPSVAPAVSSESPTQRDENAVKNGGCESGEHLFRVRMHDRWGDGWDKSAIKILEIPSKNKETSFQDDTETPPIITEDDNTLIMSSEVKVSQHHMRDYDQLPIWEERLIFKGSLEEGLSGYSYVCLRPQTCYEVVVGGGQWEDEIKWDIQSAPILATDGDQEEKEVVQVAKGWAPARCQFSVPKEASEELACPLTCDDVKDKVTEVSVAPSDAPSLVPNAFEASSEPPSDAPSLVPSDAPSGAS